MLGSFSKTSARRFCTSLSSWSGRHWLYLLCVVPHLLYLLVEEKQAWVPQILRAPITHLRSQTTLRWAHFSLFPPSPEGSAILSVVKGTNGEEESSPTTLNVNVNKTRTGRRRKPAKTSVTFANQNWMNASTTDLLPRNRRLGDQRPPSSIVGPLPTSRSAPPAALFADEEEMSLAVVPPATKSMVRLTSSATITADYGNIHLQRDGEEYCKLFAMANTYGLIDFSIFEPDYCSKPDPNAAGNAMIDPNSVDCTKLMEFLFLIRGSTKKQILHEKELFQKDLATESSYPPVMYVNRVAMFVTAHAHIVGAIISQRDQCFSEQVRLLFVVNLRRFKTLVSEQFRIIWLAYQGKDPEGYCFTEKCTKRGGFPELVDNWITRVLKLIDSDLKTFKSVLETWRPPLPEEAHFYSHETDGRFTTLEMLRRATFNEWFVDTGMLRAALRGGVFPVGSSVADLGAGTGEYARWLNDTGLVDAFSFDGSADIELLTKKKVKHLNLVTSIRRPQKYNWVLLIEICEHIPAELHPIFFQNVNLFAGDGIVLSWAPPQIPNIGHTNPLLEKDVRQVLARFLPLFAIDQESTNLLRAHSQVGWLKNTLTVLRRYPENLAAEVASSCNAQEHIMYAGEDDAVLDNSHKPQVCCDACATNPDCQFWVWSHAQRTCWLKRTKEYQTEEKGFISGSKALTRTEL